MDIDEHVRRAVADAPKMSDETRELVSRALSQALRRVAPELTDEQLAAALVALPDAVAEIHTKRLLPELGGESHAATEL